MKKLLLALLILTVYTPAAWAQVTVPNTFVSGTTILASEVNANFLKLGDALNRTGGTMTGNLLFGTDNALDIGALGASRPRDLHVGRKIYAYDLTLTNDLQGVTATFSGAVSAGGLTFNAGSITGVSSLTANGTITAQTFSGSGASLTSIPETAITDGSVFPRLNATETISGAWTHTNGLTVSSGTTSLQAVTGTTANFSSTVTGGTFSGSGASLTSIPETAITDGSTLARVAANETISGTWTFSNAPTIGGAVYQSPLGMEIFNLGGDWREFVSNAGAYPSGAGLDKLVPGSGAFYAYGSYLPGVYAIEGTCVANATVTGYLSLFNLDSAPDTPVATATFTVYTVPTRVRSGNFSFPGGNYNFGAKEAVTSGYYIACYNIRVLRTG